MPEILTRGNLPHWYVPGAAHFVTYRLAGTIPRHVLDSLAARKNELLARPLSENMTPSERCRLVHKQLFAEYDAHLDANRSIDWLARPAVAALIRRNLYHHDGAKYHLLAYTIMPNHVHVLLQPIEAVAEAARFGERKSEAGRFGGGGEAGRFAYEAVDEPCGEESDAKSPLTVIMHSLKSYTAHEANKLLARSGQFWQHESYDHWVRDDDELERIVAYIIGNPVKAGLAEKPHDWLFGSAHDRFIYDGTFSGFLGDVEEF